MTGFPPPAVPAEDSQAPQSSVSPPRRPGELTHGWSVVFALGWLGVIVGFAAVWGVSRQLGLATWWLGPRAQPQPWFISMAPFALPIALIAGVTTRARWLPWLGLSTAAVLALVAAGDLNRFGSIALVEFALAGAAAMVSIAAWSGMYRVIPASNSAT